MNATMVAQATSSAAMVLSAWFQAQYAALRPSKVQTEADTIEAAAREVVRDAAAVRALADRYRRLDPGFASDLCAAADRHERAFDTAREAASR
jgi:hypothetical protein